MNKVKLGDVCAVVSGSTPKSDVEEYWNGNIKWITPAEINSDSYIINDTERHITELAVEKTNLTALPVGTVLLTSRAPIGKTAIAGADMYCNQGFKNLICSEQVYNKYLYFFLSSKVDYLNALGRGATFKEISKGIVEAVEMPLPSLDEQKRIAELFETIQKLIGNRKRAMSTLDTLVKSRFIEMFGDILNDKNLSLSRLMDIAHISSSKRIFAREYVKEGIPFYRSKEIRELGSGLKPSVELFISKERYAEIKKDYGVPQKGDILIAAIGATIGYSWIVDTDAPFYYKDGNLILISVRDGTNPVFLNHAMNIIITDYKKKMAAGSAQMALTIEKLGQLMIVNPDKERQEAFADFVALADKSKLSIQQSIENLQTLKAKLMQEYFG